MDFYRARQYDSRYIRYEKSFIHNTALIASDEQKIIGTLEYYLENVEGAEIISFSIFQHCDEKIIFKGLIEEIAYWNPYLKSIFYNEENNLVNQESLLYCGFSKGSHWILNMNNDIKIFKIDIKEITPEQLTIDKVKLDRVSSWIRKPEDIIISCIRIDNETVCIDGYSRLVAAFNKGFDYVYAYIEPDNHNPDFYKTCMAWCKEQGIFTIKDLADRVVTPEAHERLWINRCQAYLKEQREKIQTSCL